MAIAAGAENPGAVALVGIFLSVEHAGLRKIRFVNLRVLGMHVEDRVAQNADGLDGVDGLPEHVAGIVVASDGFARDGAEPQHRLGAIDDEARMHFDGDLDAMIFSELRVPGPIRNYFLVPLPCQNIQILRWPWAGHPIRILGLVAIAGASREIDHNRHAELLSEQYGLLAGLLIS